MPTPTIETGVPSSPPDNASSPSTTPDKPAESSPVQSSPSATESRPALTSFADAFEAAGVKSVEDIPKQKPVDKTKPKAVEAKAESKAEPKPGEQKPGDKKESAKPEELPKLDSKSLLKKEDEKPKSKGDKAPEEELSMDELKEELNNPHLRDKSRRRFQDLWSKWTKAEEAVATTKKEVAAKEARLAELEAKIGKEGDKAGIPEDVQKQLEEYAMMKREKGLGDDPQVKQLFDSRVSGAEGVIMDVLTKSAIGVPQNWIDAIKAAGGLIGFSKTMPDKYGELMEALPVSEAQEIDSAMKEQLILARQKKSYIEGEKSKAVQYFADQAKAEAEAAAARPDPRKEAEAMQARFSAWKEGVKKEAADVFGEKEIPADATEEVKGQLTERNKFARQLSAALDQRVAAKSPDEWQDILLESVLAHKFAADSKSLRAENEALRAELEAVRGAGKTVARGGAVTAPAAPKESNSAPKSFAEILQETLGEQS